MDALRFALGEWFQIPLGLVMCWLTVTITRASWPAVPPATRIAAALCLSGAVLLVAALSFSMWLFKGPICLLLASAVAATLAILKGQRRALPALILPVSVTSAGLMLVLIFGLLAAIPT